MSNADSPRARDSAQDFTVGAPQSVVVLKPQTNAMTAVVCVAGYLIPGLGHLLLKRWVRGALILGSIFLMFGIGLGMHGALYRPPEPGTWISFNTLGAFANAGSGLLYIGSLMTGRGIGMPTSQTFDYGWAYLIVAGLLNYLCILDAFDIAQGRKP
jgi:hypothetical protein